MDVLSDKSKFLEDLDSYTSKVGRPIGKSPVMGYKELDLHQFFVCVMGHGGFDEVVKKVGTWAKIWKQLDNFDASVTDASFRLKRNYERCLLEYEQKRFPSHLEICKGTLSTLQKESSNSLKQRTRTPPVRRNKLGASRGSSRSSSPCIARHVSSGMEQYSYTTPLALGDFTVESFGTVVPRAPYITHKNIFTIGYTSYREFNSMLDPKVMVRYTSIISDDGAKPQFIVTASDDVANPIVAITASRAWKAVYKRIFGDTNDVKRISGSVMFGLTHPTVKRIIAELPNAKEAVSTLTPISSRNKRKPKTVDEEYDSCSSSGSYKAAKIELSSSSEDIPSLIRRQVVRSSSTSSLDYEDVVDRSFEDNDDLEAAVKTLSTLKFRL